MMIHALPMFSYDGAKPSKAKGFIFSVGRRTLCLVFGIMQLNNTTDAFSSKQKERVDDSQIFIV